jgi:hypothetical protein
MLPFAKLIVASESDTASLESGKRLVLTWINYSHGELLARETGQYNDMQVFDFGLEYMLNKYDAMQIRQWQWTDLPESLSMHGHVVTGTLASSTLISCDCCRWSTTPCCASIR